MQIEAFANEVHDNSVLHGWWDEDRDGDVILALVHSEWSEALEEYRSGKPMVYKVPYTDAIIEPSDENYAKLHTKPEGIAVELADGIIRILDYYGRCDAMKGVSATFEEFENKALEGVPEITEAQLPTLVAELHYLTSMAYEYIAKAQGEDGDTLKELARIHIGFLHQAIATACAWMKANGVDYNAVLLEKHEYNKTRPYKHGGKVC